MSRSRAFAWTLFNYTEEDVERIKNIDCRYLIFGHEICPDTGNPHLQGFILFQYQMKPLHVKHNIFQANELHIECAIASAARNYRYCKKDGEFFVKGTLPGQGKRTDLHGFVEEAKKQRLTETELIEQHTTVYARFPQFVSKVQAHYHPPESLSVLDNWWFQGSSGTGKSSTARHLYGSSLYIKSPNKWWDDYAGEETVLIDDLDPDNGKYIGYYLKLWADHYPINAEIKGGKILIRPKRIVITTQYDMDQVYQNETLEALSRRFQIRTFQ